MCGITLLPFRRICKEFGAGLVFNQMVSAKALLMGDKKSIGMLAYREDERPVGMQLFGNNADILRQAALLVYETGPDVVDLNLGCPAKKIVSDGGGSALLRDAATLRSVLRKMRRAIPGIFTIKIRAGWDEKSKNALTVARMAQDEGVDAITIHARTSRQAYTGRSDWELIRHLKQQVRIPVIGNGDITSAADAHRMLKETGCDAVMTGRGAFSQPWIFRNFVNKRDEKPCKDELKHMVLRQYEYFMEHFGKASGIKMMRKFLCAYTKGKRDGAAFRNEMVRMDNWPAIKDRLENFFKN